MHNSNYTVREKTLNYLLTPSTLIYSQSPHSPSSDLVLDGMEMCDMSCLIITLEFFLDYMCSFFLHVKSIIVSL